MLLKNTQELKRYFSSIDADYHFPSLESFVRDAIYDIVVPEIGIDQYDKVLATYESGSLEGKLKVLCDVLQKAITHLALFLNSDSGSFRISDAGYYVTASSDTKPVSDKKMVVFRKARAEAGYKALDQALLLMEQSINDPAFAEYKDSDVRKAAGGYFITGAVEFTRGFSALKNSGTTFRAILSSIGQAEQQHILPLLGEDLFDDLKERILSGSLDENTRALLIRIQKPLSLLSIAEAIPMTGFEFDGKTFSVNALSTNNDNIETAAPLGDQRLSNLMNSCVINGQKELTRLKTYLEKNAGLFPLYQKAESEADDLGINDAPRGVLFF